MENSWNAINVTELWNQYFIRLVYNLPKFTITDAMLYDPVVTSSAQDKQKTVPAIKIKS